MIKYDLLIILVFEDMNGGGDLIEVFVLIKVEKVCYVKGFCGEVE